MLPLFITQAVKASPPIYNLTGCYVANMSPRFGLTLFQSIMTEIILCICMVYKAYIVYKNVYGSSVLKLVIYDRLAFLSVLAGCSDLKYSVLYFCRLVALLCFHIVV